MLKFHSEESVTNHKTILFDFSLRVAFTSFFHFTVECVGVLVYYIPIKQGFCFKWNKMCYRLRLGFVQEKQTF